MKKITYLSLYIINQVRLRRLVLGISSRNLSEMLGHSSGYVGMVESTATLTQYPTHEWPKLAAALGCDINDLLPPGQSTSTGELIEKKVLSLSDEGDVRKVIAALKENGFFDEGVSANNNEISRLHDVSLEMTLEKLIKHLNVQDEGQIKVLRKVLEG
jgi:predicted transcriptional regulator